MTRLVLISLFAFAMPLAAQQGGDDQDSQAPQAEQAPEDQQAEGPERAPVLRTRVRRSPSGVIIISGSVARGEEEQPEPGQETPEAETQPEGSQAEGQQEGEEAAEAEEAEGESGEEPTEEGTPAPPRSRVQNVTVYGLSGNKVSVPISESEENLEGASQTSLMLTNLNGREVAYLSERERVVKESPGVKVVERRTQRYDAGGQPTQQELIREETRTLADGTVVTTATSYVEDFNGRMQPTERTVSREKKMGNKTQTTVVSEKPSINGGFRAYSREESVETRRDETSVEIRKTRKVDDGSGRLIESAREETVMTKSGNKSITQTVVYEREAMSSKMTLSSRTVGELIERPDGSSSETLQVYGLSPTAGSPRFLNASGPQLMRTITRERTLGTGGEIVETTRTRVRSFADPSRMGGEETQQKVTRPSEDGESIQTSVYERDVNGRMHATQVIVEQVEK